jgi:hypothetical protein
VKTNKYLSAFVVVLLIVSSAMAQELRTGPPVPCPHPVSLVLHAPPPSPPTRDPGDFSGTLGTATNGSVWNQTQVNKGFGYSFQLPKKECCIFTQGTLVVTVKALQGGPKGSPTSANDAVEVVHNGASVPGAAVQPFINGCTTGQTTTVTINVPANILATGIVSLYVEDDTAVISAELRLQGCCIK